MLLDVISISTNYDHWRHPFTSNEGAGECSSAKRVAGVALFVIFGTLTVGAAALFIVGMAIWKHYKNRPKDVLQDNNRPKDVLQEVEKVKELSKSLPAQGKQLCLFIGRQRHEELPQAENEVWVSLDPQLGKPTLDQDRIHLQAEIGSAESFIPLKRMEKLFDRVVLDQSTLKFIGDDPWRKLARLLKDDPNSTLITEATTGTNALLDAERMQQWTLRSSFPYGGFAVPLLEMHLAKDAQEQTAIRAKYCTEMYRKTNVYLSTLFAKVEHIQDRPYPYATNYRDQDGKDDYYVLQGPNVAELSKMALEYRP